MPVDLHTHTTHSDGTLSPAALVRLANEEGLTALAVTDHDVTTANQEALEAAKDLDLTVVPGVELSIDHELPPGGHMDIIGLFIDHRHPDLNERLDFLRSERRVRNDRILEKLNDLGINLSAEDVRRAAGEGSMGRPHIARVLVDQNHVGSIDEAFQRYLKNGAPAFVEKAKLTVIDAIALIHRAGGLAILAHPFSLGFSTYRDLSGEISTLKKIGLHGLETYYPSYSKDMSRSLRRIASENGLLESGGSDFHGANKPYIQLGSGAGNLIVPDTVYEKLQAFWRSGPG